VRGDREIAIGNLIGSSIYNIAVVLGLTVMVAPNGMPVPHEVLVAAWYCWWLSRSLRSPYSCPAPASPG